jgi:hypothetical protein
MPILSVARDYIIWHYTRAYADIFHIWLNYLWFINHLFAVPDVMMSWFAPFKRLQENKVSIMKSPEDFFANLFVNIMMRIVGAFIRTAIIVVAGIGFIVVNITGLTFFALWTILPVLIVHFLLTSIRVFFL